MPQYFIGYNNGHPCADVRISHFHGDGWLIGMHCGILEIHGTTCGVLDHIFAMGYHHMLIQLYDIVCIYPRPVWDNVCGILSTSDNKSLGNACVNII